MSNTPRHAVIKAAINAKNVSPCKNCTDRQIRCHSECQKYAEYKNKITAEGNAAYTMYSADRMLESSEIYRKQKIIKNGNRGQVKKWNQYKGG